MKRSDGYAAGETILAVAKKHQVHRRLVRQALANALPPERKKQSRVPPKLGPVKEFIEQILKADGEAPRKQRYTARRIWRRLRDEHPEQGVAESTIREYVRGLGIGAAEVFVPQAKHPKYRSSL